VKTRTAAQNVTFKLQDVQQMAERNFAAVTMEGRAAVCRHVRAVGGEYVRREHGMDSDMGRIITNPNGDDDDDNDDMSEYSVSCDDNDDIQGVGTIVIDRQ